MHIDDYDAHDGNSLIFYKYNKKQKKYESIIQRYTNSYSISKFDQSNILITYDKKYEYSSHGDYFIRKIDLNEEKVFLDMKIIIKLEKFEKNYNIDLVLDCNINKRI